MSRTFSISRKNNYRILISQQFTNLDQTTTTWQTFTQESVTLFEEKGNDIFYYSDGIPTRGWNRTILSFIEKKKKKIIIQE